MMPERKTFQPVPPKSISQAYELLHNKGFIAFPLTQSAEEKASAIVATITESYFGKEIYETVEEKAVAYLYLLIKDHPFTDGNKRTASLVFSMVCDINELAPRFGNGYPTLDELAVFIEKVQEQDHQKVIRLIAKVLFEVQE
jgi:prophage maintenance system killer protein